MLTMTLARMRGGFYFCRQSIYFSRSSPRRRRRRACLALARSIFQVQLNGIHARARSCGLISRDEEEAGGRAPRTVRKICLPLLPCAPKLNQRSSERRGEEGHIETREGTRETPPKMAAREKSSFFGELTIISHSPRTEMHFVGSKRRGGKNHRLFRCKHT